MGQSGSKKLRNSEEQTDTTIISERSHTDVKTAFIVIGQDGHFKTAEALRDSLEDSDGGRVKVSDLADVSKSEGSNFDEKLDRYLKNSTGIVIICSDALKACIDGEESIEVTINHTKITMNGKVMKKFLEDEEQRRKFIPLGSNECQLPEILSDKKMIKIAEGEVDEDKIEKISNEIRAVLEGFLAST